jgi:hypothetical protein
MSILLSTIGFCTILSTPRPLFRPRRRNLGCGLVFPEVSRVPMMGLITGEKAGDSAVSLSLSWNASCRVLRRTEHPGNRQILLWFFTTPGNTIYNMPPSDFAKVDVDEIVEKLTTDEAILLTAGVGFWHTHEIPRLGIPAIKVRDNILPVHYY